MKVSELMTTGVVSGVADDTVATIMERMVMRRCGAIPIISGQELIGIITVRDILLPLYPNYGDYVHDSVRARDFEAMEEGYPRVLEQRAGEIMTPDPLTVSPADPVLKAASTMGLRNLRRIPVAIQGRLVGMISLGDISRGLYLQRRG